MNRPAKIMPHEGASRVFNSLQFTVPWHNIPSAGRAVARAPAGDLAAATAQLVVNNVLALVVRAVTVATLAENVQPLFAVL
jgi:hypothetical protein